MHIKIDTEKNTSNHFTPQQISWIKSHDWFVGLRSEDGAAVVLDAYTKNGSYYSEIKAFTDLEDLYRWAGY